MQRTLEKQLIKWKTDAGRLPIILRGARQVGKSYVIEKFGKEQFANLVIANFEFQPALKECFKTLDPRVICKQLEILLNQRIEPGSTLLFLDEIQNCPEAIRALRYFKEKYAELHVIAAGSLLEFALHEEQFSFPVGRVEFMYLRPLSFQEFLISQRQTLLVESLNEANINKPVHPVVHEHLLKFLKLYFLIGGMPATVMRYLETQSFLECQRRLLNILETYRADFPKYATKAQYNILQLFFEKTPDLVGQHFKFSYIDPKLRSRELKIALQQLEWAGLINRVVATNASGIPLQAHVQEKKFKLLFLDLGLMNAANHMEFQTIWETEIAHLHTGSLAEQFVGQELLAYAEAYDKGQLYYWERDKRGSQAEIDYVIQVGSSIIPIEVKSGTTGRLRSLTLFKEEKGSPVTVRISQHPLSFHEGMLSIPFYHMDKVAKLVKAAMDLS